MLSSPPPLLKLFKLKLWFTTCFIILLNLSPAHAIETVSISTLYPKNEHACVTACIYIVGSSDIGNVLSCGNPYDNNCFCNTGAAAATSVSSWFTACGSERCSAGDITADLSVMKKVYASYCMNAGYTQVGATEWYTGGVGGGGSPSTAKPGQTPTSNSAQTTVVLTVVTETVTSASSTTTQPQVVTIHSTSTLFVDSSGNPVPAPRTNSGPSKTTLGVGIGVGVPLALAIVGLGIWFCLRRRRQQRRTQPPAVPGGGGGGQAVEPGIEFVPTSAIQRKPLQSQGPPPPPQVQMSEVTTGHEERLDTFPVPVSPHSQTSTPAVHEVGNERSVGELSGHSHSPPPAYLQSTTSQPGSGHGNVQGQRWELG